MPTIGEVYNPLVKAATEDDPNAMSKLRAVGQMLFEHNPGLCPSLEAGIEQAKRNLDYYCQYFDPKIADKTKHVYGLGSGFRDLAGNKWTSP